MSVKVHSMECNFQSFAVNEIFQPVPSHSPELFLWGVSRLTSYGLWMDAPPSFLRTKHVIGDWLLQMCLFIIIWNLYPKVVIASSVLIGLVTGCHFPITCKSSNYQVRRQKKKHSPSGFCCWKCSLQKLKNNILCPSWNWPENFLRQTVINNSKQTNKKYKLLLWLLGWVCVVCADRKAKVS